VPFIERETLDSALMSGRSVLELMGIEPHRARTLAQRFRRHSVQQLLEMAPHMGDEKRLISMTKAGREQLEQLLAQERELAERTRGRSDEPATGNTANADRPTST
jgi:glutathione-regulated potassium-efflux system ancillary protein KefC